METSNQVAARILRRAALIISQPGSWTQGVMARDAHGDAVMAMHNAATSWCGDGAVFRAATMINPARVNDARHFAHLALDVGTYVDLSTFNDRCDVTAGDVAYILREGAALAEAA